MLKSKTSSNASFISHHLSLLKPNYLQQSLQPQQILTEKLLTLLKECSSIRTLKQIHTHLLVNAIHKPNHLLAKVIDLKDFGYSNLLFSHLPQPNDYSFNVMIRGLATTWQKYSPVLQLYYEMKSLGLKPNNFTYPFVFIACGNLLDLNHGRAAHCSLFKIGLDTDAHICHSLITMYTRCGAAGFARKVFDEIGEQDTVSWNSMISGYVKMGYAAEAVMLFGRMREIGFELDERTLVSVLAACGDLGDLTLGKWVEEYVMGQKMQMNSYVGSALIDMYGKCGDLRSARRIFDGMLAKDRVTWNAMITGYAQNGMSDEAIMLFNYMREANTSPDIITLIEVLSACSSIGAIDMGKWIDNYSSQRGLQSDVYVATALIDMYAKCGSLDNALRIFENMPHKNEVSWNVMISALAFHGRPQEALCLFERMLNDGGAARPNDVTFIGVLAACVHGGLADRGRQLFDMMSSSFGLVPKVEHYSCMVDLLARTGHLNEAWNLVEKMPEKPDEVALGALLGACQRWKDGDVGERVVQLILEIDPSNSGNYVISSKIFANLNQWNEAAKMRVLMRQRGVSKTPGCSWVEIESQIYEFHAGDELRQDCIEIYKVLMEEMKREGYVPRVDLL